MAPKNHTFQFTLSAGNVASHVAPVENQLQYRLTVPLLEMGRKVFKDAMKSHSSELDELTWDAENGWMVWSN